MNLDGVEVNSGEIIGLVDGRLCASGPEMRQVISQVLEGMEMEEREIISIYYGADVKLQEAEDVGEQVESLYPDVEVELLAGGQAHYFYILGAE